MVAPITRDIMHRLGSRDQRVGGAGHQCLG
jgi:hypothetical protein